MTSMLVPKKKFTAEEAIELFKRAGSVTFMPPGKTSDSAFKVIPASCLKRPLETPSTTIECSENLSVESEDMAEQENAGKTSKRRRKNKNNKDNGDNTPEQDDDTDFETWVRNTLTTLNTNTVNLTATLLGDEKKHVKGVVARVTELESEINGTESSEGLKKRVENLENNTGNNGDVIPSSKAPGVSASEYSKTKEELDWIRATNEVLIGAVSKLEKSNASLQNQVLIQHDKLNIRNLNLGGVEQIEGESCKTQAVAFFKNILKINDVTEADFLQAYRKTKPNSYEENVEVSQGVFQKKQVDAPGIMYVRLSTEHLRHLAIQKARGLTGKRHPTKNHKYFATAVESEAVKALKEKNHGKVQTLLEGNRKGKNDTFFFSGKQFIVNGVVQLDRITTPTFAEIYHEMEHNHEALKVLEMCETEDATVFGGSKFLAYALRTKRLDVVRLAYIKVYILHPGATHVMMAYRVLKKQGSCDDNEHKAGHKILRTLQRKKMKDAAVFIVRLSDGQRIGPRRFHLIVKEAEGIIDYMQRANTQNFDDIIPAASPDVLASFQGGDDVDSSQGSQPE